MPSNLTDHSEITVFKSLVNNADLTYAINEKATQVYLRGVPAMLTVGGVVQEWDGVSFLGGSGTGILGISEAKGANLPTDGAGAPTKLADSIGFPGATPTTSGIPYFANAVNIFRGVPATDGRGKGSVANDDVVFIGQVDNNAFAVAADATPVQADIGKEFGLTKDATGHWYIDRAKTTVGTNTAVVVVGLDPVVGSSLNGLVQFMFKTAIQQFGH